MGTDSATYVFVAGIDNSGPEHWQAKWHARTPNSVWVEHTSWANPVRDTWVKELDDALGAITGPKILIAHSLGCTLVIDWAAERHDDAVAGAFLVALPDVHGPAFPAAASGFSSRYSRLPFRTLLVASGNDPYGSVEHSTAAAERLGARLVNVGRKGHLNAESGLGDWSEGWALFSAQFAR